MPPDPATLCWSVHPPTIMFGDVEYNLGVFVLERRANEHFSSETGRARSECVLGREVVVVDSCLRAVEW